MSIQTRQHHYLQTAMGSLATFIIYILIADAIIKLEAESTKERTQLFQRFILHQNQTRCSELKPDVYETCRVYDESDEKAIGNDCVHQPCRDTSFNKTCLPVSASFLGPGGISSYTCMCQEHKKPQLSSSEYHWSQWHSISGSRSGLCREMKDMLAANPPVLAVESR